MNKKRPRITEELKLLYATLVAKLGETQQAIAEVNRQMLIHVKEKYDTYDLSPDDQKDRDWCKKAFRQANPIYPKYCPPDSKYFNYVEEQKTFLAGKKIKELNQRINRRQLTLDNLIAAVEIPAISLLSEKIKETSGDFNDGPDAFEGACQLRIATYESERKKRSDIARQRQKEFKVRL